MTNRMAVAIVTVVVAAGLLAGGAVLSSIGDTGTGDPGTSSSEVRERHSTMHMDRVGRPTVVGELVNGRSEALTDVSIEVTFYEDGESVETVAASVVGTPVPGGERTPFVARIDEGHDLPDDFQVAVTDTRTANGSVYDGLAVTDERLVDRAQDQLFLSGRVENRGDRTTDALVVATFYDENGSVIGVRQARPSPGTLEPGANASFRVRFRTLGDVPSRARDFADFELRAVSVEGDGQLARLRCLSRCGRQG